MAIPRLAPADNPITVEVEINERLRPYLERWYLAKKQDGDTPSTFILRLIKQQALRDYLRLSVQGELSAIEAAKKAATDALGADVAVLESDVE